MPAQRVARRPVRTVREDPVDLSPYDEPDDGVDEPRSSRRSSIRRSRAPEPDEEPRSRGRRHHQGDGDDGIVERPSRGRTRPRPVDEDDADDADDEPRGRRGRSEPPVKVDTSGGFAKFRQERAKSGGGFPDSFKPEEKETYLVYFLEDEPFSVYGQHWIDEIKDGRRSFVCLGSENGCPLCEDLGDTPRAMALFNIVVWEEVKKGRTIDLVPTFKIWECGPQIASILAGVDDELGEGVGLTTVYVTVRKTSNGASGRKKRLTWTIHPIKERDVEDDWDVDPLTDEDLDVFEAEMKDDTLVKPDSRSDLRQVVKEVQRMQD